MKYATFKERFDEKWMQIPFCDCWLWIGANNGMYGKFNFAGICVSAHRVSWELHRGEIPEEMDVLHTCDTPLCVNPDHLWLGTKKDNQQDSIRKGRKRNQYQLKAQARSR